MAKRLYLPGQPVYASPRSFDVQSLSFSHECALHLCWHLTDGMYQAFVPGSHSTTDGDTVCHATDLGRDCHSIATGNSESYRPSLGSGSGRNTYGVFSAHNQCVRGSQHPFSFIWSTGVFTIGFRIKSTADGAQQFWAINNGNSTAQAGFSISKTASNTIRLLATRAAAGQVVFDCTTTDTIVAADGWQTVWFEGDGTDIKITIGDGSTQTFSGAVGTKAAAGTASGALLFIGQRENSTAPFVGHMGDVIIIDRALTSDEKSEFAAYNPTRSSVKLSRVLPDCDGTELWHYSGFHTLVDFTEPSRLWQDTAKSTPVVTHNDPIRVAADPLGRYYRDAVAASDGDRPLWQANQYNGLGCALFDGTDDNLVLGTEVGSHGGFTFVGVIKQTDLTNGSHLLSGSVGYWVVTGTNYSGAAYPGQSYQVLHTSGGSGVLSSSAAVNEPDALNLWVGRRDGSSNIAETGGRNREYKTTSTEARAIYSNMGDPPSGWVDWNFTGHYVLMAYYGVCHTDDILGRICRIVADKIGVPNSAY